MAIDLIIEAALRLGPPALDAIMAIFDNMRDNDELTPEEFEEAKAKIKSKRQISDAGYDAYIAGVRARLAAKGGD